MRADLRADQQPGKKPSTPIGCPAREKGARANLEEHGGQLLGCFCAARYPRPEAVVAMGTVYWTRKGMAQDGMGAQDLEQFARHRRCKAFYTPAGQPHPLRVGSWHADDATEAGPECAEPKQLRFFSTHHVFLAGDPLADAGENAGGEACVAQCRNHSSVGQRPKIDRRIEIGCLHPTLPGARHTANQHVDLWSLRGKIPCEEDTENARIGIGRQLAHALIGRARERYVTACANAPRTQIGSAPVDGNPFGFTKAHRIQPPSHAREVGIRRGSGQRGRGRLLGPHGKRQAHNARERPTDLLQGRPRRSEPVVFEQARVGMAWPAALAIPIGRRQKP